MGAFGDDYPLELGGQPSEAEQIYRALWDAVGEGNRGEYDSASSIVEAWRRSKARGIAAGIADERAVLQLQPATATDFVARFQNRLRLHFQEGTSDQERRDSLQARYTHAVDATGPGLLEQIQEINPNAEIVTVSRTTGRDTQHGRAFEDHDPGNPKAAGPAFALANGQAGTRITSVPNFSTDFILVVHAPPMGPAWSKADAAATSQIRELLDRELPAWMDIRIYAACGFDLDLDLLDITAFC